MNNFSKPNSFKDFIECPHCKSTNIFAANKVATFSVSLFICCLIGLCICVWIPFVGWFVGPIIFLIGLGCIITLLFSFLTKYYTLTCRRCNYKYKINKKYYKNFFKNTSKG